MDDVQELGNEAVTYVLRSGAEGSIHIDHVLEYNQDPDYLAELLSHKLAVEAVKRIEKSASVAANLRDVCGHHYHSSIDFSTRPTPARA